MVAIGAIAFAFPIAHTFLFQLFGLFSQNGCLAAEELIIERLVEPADLFAEEAHTPCSRFRFALIHEGHGFVLGSGDAHGDDIPVHLDVGHPIDLGLRV